MKQKLFSLFLAVAGLIVGTTVVQAESTVVGYTEAISGSRLSARALSNGSLDNLTISDPKFGSNITDYKGTSKTVEIDGTGYANTDSWRKSVNGSYDNQNVGYTLTVGSGYKMNISSVNARIAVAEDTYTWYVEILNSAGTQVWKSSEITTTIASSGKIDNVDVTSNDALQGLTGAVTVNLWVKQGGSTKYFSINYLQLSVELEEDSRTNYTVSAAVADGQSDYGSIDKAGENSVAEGDGLSLTASANAGYAFVNWTKDDEVISTNATLVLSNVTADAAYVANFKKLYKATYNLGGYAGTITGKVLCSYNAANGVNEIYADANGDYTIPAYASKYLYCEGYVFAGWQCAGNTYADGATIEGLTADITLTPTWTATTATLSESSASTTVTWSLAKSNIVFMDWQSSTHQYGYYTQTARVNGESIAVPMKIMDGKVGNYNRTDALAQTNQNTIFTIPAVKGMTVAIPNAYKEISTTTIAGATDYTGTGTKSISYTYTGDAETIDIVIGESNQYLTSIVVTYPLVETLATSDLAITSSAELELDAETTTSQITYSSSSTGAVSYQSDDTNVATVTSTGLISAVANGTAVITVRQAADDNYQAGSATISVTVNNGIIVPETELSLVYTASGYDSETLTWTNGTYSLVATTGGISGNDGSCFKLQNRTYTLKMPDNIKVNKIGYTGYDYNGNHQNDAEGTLSNAKITVDGTVELTGWKGYYSNYNSAENTAVLESISHTAGNDITLVVTDAGQIIGTLVLYVCEVNPGIAPTLESTSNTTTHNGTVILNFSSEMQEASATINGETVTAEGGSSSLTFYYWGLEYGSEASFAIPANTLKDKYGNVYEEAVNITFTVDDKPILTKKKFDVIVGTDSNEDLQTVLDTYKSYSGTDRVYIFIPDGTYKLTGNTSITTNNAGSSYAWDEETGTLTQGTVSANTTYDDNAITQLRSSNLSIIGQSKENTILYNIPYIPGISYTSTLEIRSGSDNYLQDFTLKNMYAGGAHDKGVAVAFYDRGTRTIAKNINCWSNQDTYVSNGARDYYETSTFAGTVDFICGNGDVWFEGCDLVINNRTGNVIAAPRTNSTEQWGYVFNSCTISKAEGATNVSNGNWNLGRPWGNSPAATYLNTTMNVIPSTAAWTNMSGGLVVRFHEYGSVDANGDAIDLSGRSIAACSAADDSDAPVLTAEQAAEYTLHNVLGGTDGWDPTEYTAQVAVENVTLKGNVLSWDDNDDALCWMVFKDGAYYDNVITTSIELTENGSYTVRAANARGGLGEASAAVTYYAVVLYTSQNMEGYRTFYNEDSYTADENTKVYVAVSRDEQANTISLKALSDNVIPAKTPVILKTTSVCAEPTTSEYYQMTLTLNQNETSSVENMLHVSVDGDDFSSGVYRLGYRSVDDGGIGVGFYTWTTRSPGRGIVYLDKVCSTTSAKLRFVFEEEEEEEATAVGAVSEAAESATSGEIYNVAGQKVGKSYKGLVIRDGKKYINK